TAPSTTAPSRNAGTTPGRRNASGSGAPTAPRPRRRGQGSKPPPRDTLHESGACGRPIHFGQCTQPNGAGAAADKNNVVRPTGGVAALSLRCELAGRLSNPSQMAKLQASGPRAPSGDSLGLAFPAQPRTPRQARAGHRGAWPLALPQGS